MHLHIFIFLYIYTCCSTNMLQNKGSTSMSGSGHAMTLQMAEPGLDLAPTQVKMAFGCWVNRYHLYLTLACSVLNGCIMLHLDLPQVSNYHYLSSVKQFHVLVAALTLRSKRFTGDSKASGHHTPCRMQNKCIARQTPVEIQDSDRTYSKYLRIRFDPF